MRVTLLLLAIIPSIAQAFSELYVNCDSGSDATGDGSSGSPFATLMHARDVVRAAQPLAGPMSVLVQPSDCYPLDASGSVNFSFPILALETQDGGSADAPITYGAAVGSGVRLLGGAPVPPALWKASSSLPGVFTADLGAGGANLARWGLGDLAGGGLGTCASTKAELFWNASAMTLARYPNISPNGTWEWLNIGGIFHENPLAFSSNDSHVASWAAEVGTGWIHGFWSYDWSDSFCRLSSVSPLPPSSLSPLPPTSSGNFIVNVSSATPPVYGFLPTARFYGVNLLSELDVAGEYYVDVAAEVLYFMPPGGDPTAAEAFLSFSDSIVTAGVSSSTAGSEQLRDLRENRIFPNSRAPAPQLPSAAALAAESGAAAAISYVTIASLDVHFARTAGIVVANGNHVLIVSLDASNHGHTGITAYGTNNVISNVTVRGTGCEACSMAGGSTASLSPGNNSVVDSLFDSYARIIRTYNPGIGFGGVGNLYARNTLSNAPHQGITGGGALNDFLNNTFEDLCFEATDSGAWYAGRSWTQRGNRLIGNTFRRIVNREKMTLGAPSVQAIYNDDQLSGTIMVNNVCEDSMLCFFVGGGRDAIIEGNLCNNTGTCVHVDNRGMNWQLPDCTYNASYAGALVEGLFAVNYTSPPYSTAFPEIVNTLQNHPCVPVNISIQNNRYCNTPVFLDANVSSWYDNVTNNVDIC